MTAADSVYDERKGKYRAESVSGGVTTEDNGGKVCAPPAMKSAPIVLICAYFTQGGGKGGFGGGKGGGGGDQTCWDFQKGMCNRGDSCRFSHAGGGDGGGKVRQSVPVPLSAFI